MRTKNQARPVAGAPIASGASIDTGRTFYAGPSGRWAGEQLLRAVQEGRPLSPSVLRSAATLRKDEWIHLDTVLVQEGAIRLRGVAQLMAAGLTINVPNAMGKTVFQWEDMTDMNPAETSLSGVVRTEDDAVDFELGNLPLPITHKDFNLNLRTLAASRERGEPLDTTQARVSGRLVAEQIEKMLFQGGRTFGGNHIYGLTNHPNRNAGAFAAGTWSGAGVTGEQMLTDVLTWIGLLEADRMFGPYWLFVPSGFSTNLEKDFKANSDKTIRQRLMEVDRLNSITTVDQLQANNAVLVQATVDVVALVEGEPLQSIQWDIEGGFIVKFKAFTIQVPLIRADAQGRSGVVHAS
jgi:hypothetical protein